jgi:hypothetical protein
MSFMKIANEAADVVEKAHTNKGKSKMQQGNKVDTSLNTEGATSPEKSEDSIDDKGAQNKVKPALKGKKIAAIAAKSK